jgi:hypothetical protein
VLARKRGLDSIFQLVLGDLGSVIEGGSESAPLPVTSPCGTPGFVAPEAFQCSETRPCLDPFAADVFSFGVLASVVVSGVVPGGDTTRQCGTPSSGASVVPPHSSRSRSGGELSAWDDLRGLISACCVDDPSMRPRSGVLLSLRGGVCRVEAGEPTTGDMALAAARARATSGAHGGDRRSVVAVKSESEEPASRCESCRVLRARVDALEAQVAVGISDGAGSSPPDRSACNAKLLAFLRASRLEGLLDQQPALCTFTPATLLRRTDAELRRILGDELFESPDGRRLVTLVESARP